MLTHQIIFYGSFLLFPLLAFFGYLTYKKPGPLQIIALICILALTYTRFIETQIIQVKTTQIDIGLNQQIKIAILADPQLGVYRQAQFAKRITRKTNQLKPDLILIPGDITYKSTVQNTPDLLESFRNLKADTLAVLGNHDYRGLGKPSDEISQSVTSALNSFQIPVIDNQIHETEYLTLVGYGSIFANNFNTTTAQNLQTNKPAIALMHNPDGTYLLDDQQFDLSIAGHTHCGQMQVPFIYKSTIPTINNFESGLQSSPAGPLYVSCGLGESLLPMRLFNPPTIDLLVLN